MTFKWLDFTEREIECERKSNKWLSVTSNLLWYNPMKYAKKRHFTKYFWHLSCIQMSENCWWKSMMMWFHTSDTVWYSQRLECRFMTWNKQSNTEILIYPKIISLTWIQFTWKVRMPNIHWKKVNLFWGKNKNSVEIWIYIDSWHFQYWVMYVSSAKILQMLSLWVILVDE